MTFWVRCFNFDADQFFFTQLCISSNKRHLQSIKKKKITVFSVCCLFLATALLLFWQLREKALSFPRSVSNFCTAWWEAESTFSKKRLFQFVIVSFQKCKDAQFFAIGSPSTNKAVIHFHKCCLNKIITAKSGVKSWIRCIICLWTWWLCTNTKQKTFPENKKLFGQKHESITLALNNLSSWAPTLPFVGNGSQLDKLSWW